jgi:hypothetical protein
MSCMRSARQRDRPWANNAQRGRKNTSDRYKAPGTRSDASATAPNPSAKSLHSISGSSEGRLNITFCPDLPYVALPDLGADDNVLPRSLLRSLERQGLLRPSPFS